MNQPISQLQFERLYQKAQDYMSDKELFVFDGYAGADSEYRLAIRIVNEYALERVWLNWEAIKVEGYMERKK